MSNPTVVGYSRGDLNTWSELCARVAVAGGAHSHDVAQIAFGYGLTTGAFGMHAGLERVGATVIPASTGNTQRQLQIMRDFKTTVLVGTPSYAMHMADVARRAGLRLRGPASCGWDCSGPSRGRIRLRDEIERRTGMSACDNYGLSEVIGPGVSYECWNKDGLHINEDHFLVEVVDPATGEPVPEGKEGELVFTSLTKEAVPVIRYRTGDLASVSYRPCACGRVFARHSKVYARTDDMLVIRGVNVYPGSIEAVLSDIEKVEPHYQIVLYRRGRARPDRDADRGGAVVLPRRGEEAAWASSDTSRSGCGRSWASGRGCGWWSPRPSPVTTAKARRVIDKRGCVKPGAVSTVDDGGRR